MLRSVPTLVYHQIVDGTPEEVHAVSSGRFREQMRWLADEGYRTVRLDTDLPAGSPRRKTIAITFDDGYLDNYTRGMPLLQSLGFTAVFFPVAERIGGVNDWDRAGGSPGAALMDWPELDELARAGFEIGSHTCTHPILTELSPADAVREIRRSKEIIEEKLQTPVRSFSYPYSRYNRDHQQALAASGYRQACTYLPGYCGGAGSERFALRRMAVLAHDTLEDFAGKVRGSFKFRLRWLRRQMRARWSA